MTFFIIIIAGVIGTMVMTCFSHILELISGIKFNEAQLLNILIAKSKSGPKIGENHLFGWIIHFLIGILMALGLWFYYSEFSTNSLAYYGICVGFGLGLIGVTGWTLILKVHHDPPSHNWAYFFAQLIIAHIFFSVTATTFLRCTMSY